MPNERDWRPELGPDGAPSGTWYCRVCHRGNLRTDSRGRHEQSTSHQNFLLNPVHPPTSSTQSPAPSHQDVMQATMLSLLAQVEAAGQVPARAGAMLAPAFAIGSNAPPASFPNGQFASDLPAPESSPFDNFEMHDSGDFMINPTIQEDIQADFRSSIDDFLAGKASVELLPLGSDSESEAGAERSDDDNADADQTPATQQDASSGSGLPRPRNYRSSVQEQCEWFPWDDKLTCTLDVLNHLPRSAFSENQLELLTWLLEINGVNNTPSVDVMKAQQRRLQELVGIDSVRYSGRLGHTYYVNDLRQIIAQEMANPVVREHLHFYPEDSGKELQQAWQAARWLRDMDPSCLTPMIRIQKGAATFDYYIFEPLLLRNNTAWIPYRWFTKPPIEGERRRYYAAAYRMDLRYTHGNRHWVVREDIQQTICSDDFMFSLPDFATTAATDPSIESPHNIQATLRPDGSEIASTRRDYTNPWRTRAMKDKRAHRVVTFMLWMYCDDTSGNSSKRWNKHNSFLVTAAGLPREQVHQEYNIHFLSTSNIAPPLEMLDGIVEQLRDGQSNGIWAWDCVYNEWVLVVPQVLALLGDNPMQSELAGHIGLVAKAFCRACYVSTGKKDPKPDALPSEMDIDDESDDEDEPDDRASVVSAGSHATVTLRRRIKENFGEMLNRVKRFMTKGTPRSRAHSVKVLEDVFQTGTRVGGITQAKKLKTRYGLKDTFADTIMHSIQGVMSDSKLSPAQKETRTAEIVARVMKDAPVPAIAPIHLSPVWRIQGLDPHADTPVEILHTVLLGFLKYFWRDAVRRLDASKKAVLIARLDSVSIEGLGITKISGKTLVQYCNSLTGRDFRIIAQVAPFVLHGLGLPDACLNAWSALALLVPLLWQPEYEDLDKHLKLIQDAIDYLLVCTARWTPRWFNKPKFHIIVHVVDHIRRFGPACLFATEGFESFNAIIRAKSIHSNRQAPSRDIARAFAQSNRVRHLISGGLFWIQEELLPSQSMERFSREVRSLPTRQPDAPALAKPFVLCRCGPAPLSLIRRFPIVAHYIGVPSRKIMDPGACSVQSKTPISWDKTRSSRKRSDPPLPLLRKGVPAARNLTDAEVLKVARFRICDSVTLENGDTCGPHSWVLAKDPREQITGQRVARIEEVLQIENSPAAHQGLADFIMLRFAKTSGTADILMPTFDLEDIYVFATVSSINCSANVQHNCSALGCSEDGRQTVREEREDTQTTRAAVKHVRASRHQTDGTLIPQWILNTAKMRDAKYVQRFRCVSPAVDVTAAIKEGAQRELTDQAESHTNDAPLRHPRVLQLINGTG